MGSRLTLRKMSSRSLLSSETCVPLTRLYLSRNDEFHSLQERDQNLRRHQGPGIRVLDCDLERFEVDFTERTFTDFAWDIQSALNEKITETILAAD